MICGCYARAALSRFQSRRAPMESVTVAMERDVQLIEWLDMLGYEEAWVGEHHSSGYETVSSPEL